MSTSYSHRTYRGEADYGRMLQLHREIFGIVRGPIGCTAGELEWWRFQEKDPEGEIASAQLWERSDGSLAGYAWEHPDHPFPELVEAEVLFEAELLGHPLLPAAHCVRNSIALTQRTPLVIISGSNMSGKSTLLRSVGTNTVLALAGAPICAARLRLSPLQVGSAMRIHDSLQDGKSFFYAGVSRLKQIVSLSDNQPPENTRVSSIYLRPPQDVSATILPSSRRREHRRRLG